MLINNIESDQASAEANNDHPLLQPLVIGGLTIENRLMVAPMAGVTDNPFRRLCKSFGAGHAVSEMIIADTAL